MSKLALALDVSNKWSAKFLASKTKDYVDIYKIGLQLFLADVDSRLKIAENNEFDSREPL